MMVGDRLFDRPGGIEEPAIIIGLLVVARTEARVGENVGEIGADRSGLRDNMFFAYSRDWLIISSAVSVGRCFTETSAGAPADGGAIGAGAGACANTVLAIKVVVTSTFTFTTAPFLSPLVAHTFPSRRTSEED